MTRSESSLAAKDRERPQSGGKALPPMACEEEINRVFHLRHESAAVAVPPDLLHAWQAVGIYVLGPDHLFKTKAALAAPDAARLHPAVRGLDVVSCFGIGEAPHGGVKSSGIGRSHGRFGLEEMVWPKYVDSDRLPRMKKVWWYGYSGGFMAQMENSVDFLFARHWWQRLAAGLRSLAIFRRKG